MHNHSKGKNMRKQMAKIIALSIGLLLSSQTNAKALRMLDTFNKNNVTLSQEQMVEVLEEAKKGILESPHPEVYKHKYKTYKENPEEPFSYWEEKIFKDLARNYKKLFTQDIVPNIDTVINSTKSDPTSKVASLLDTQSEYQEKAAIAVWNNLISKRPDSKNARSAFCKVAGDTVSIKGQRGREKLGEICDKDFQLDPTKHFKWAENRTPEVINSVLIAPKLK